MKVSIASNEVYRKFQEYLKIYPSRKAAFRAAKRDGNIPISQHPEMVVIPNTDFGDQLGLDERNVRLYVFNIIVGIIAIEYHIREDREAFYGSSEGNQGSHFNSGEPPGKLKKHHYWKDDNH